MEYASIIFAAVFIIIIINIIIIILQCYSSTVNCSEMIRLWSQILRVSAGIWDDVAWTWSAEEQIWHELQNCFVPLVFLLQACCSTLFYCFWVIANTHTHTHTGHEQVCCCPTLSYRHVSLFLSATASSQLSRVILGVICVSLSGSFRGLYYKEHNSQSQFPEIRMIPAGRDDKRTMLL